MITTTCLQCGGRVEMPETRGDIEQAARHYVAVYCGWIKCEDTGGALNAAFNDLLLAVSQEEKKSGK